MVSLYRLKYKEFNYRYKDVTWLYKCGNVYLKVIKILSCNKNVIEEK